MTKFQASNEHRVSAEAQARTSYNALDIHEANEILGFDGSGDGTVSARVERETRELLDWLASQTLKVDDAFVENDYDHNGGYSSSLAVFWALRQYRDQGEACFEYVREMVAKVTRSGLSVAQVRGLLNCMRAQALREARQAEAQAINETPIEELPFGEFTAIVSMLERMQASGLKHPKVRIETSDATPVVLSIAGQRARFPGSLNVTDSPRFGGEFFGRISRAGEADARLQRRQDVLDALRQLADDPESALAAYGQRTGNCGICGRFLSNSESVERGIGPICADKAGL